jgi:hypothetical protein
LALGFPQQRDDGREAPAVYMAPEDLNAPQTTARARSPRLLVAIAGGKPAETALI